MDINTTPTVDAAPIAVDLPAAPTPTARRWSRPPADVLESEAELRVIFDMPGVRADDVAVELAGRVLTVSGVRSDGLGLRRALQLGDTVAPDGMEASLERGVLTVRLPKRAAAAPRRIAVRA
jgi:HSP20 family protein